jgi:fatty acid desaturase
MKTLRWMPDTRSGLRRTKRNAVIWFLLGLGGSVNGLLARLPWWDTVVFILMVVYAVTLFLSSTILLHRGHHGRDHTRRTD